MTSWSERGEEPRPLPGARRGLLRAARVGEAVTVHLDGHLQSGGRFEDPVVQAELDGAADLVVEAQRRADELIQQATAEVHAIHERARRAGHREGVLEGIADGRAEMAQTLAMLQQAVREGVSLRDQIVAGAEAQIVELVIDAARLVLSEAAVDPLVTVDTVRRAIARAGGQQVVRVHVHPERVEVVREAFRGEEPRWEAVPDGAIELGGCIVDTARGRIDARLDVQLDAIARALREAVPDAA